MTYTHFWMPSAEDIDAIANGTETKIVDTFGNVAEIVNVFASGIDTHGKKYVCFYTARGAGASMSDSIKEGKLHRRAEHSSRFTSRELDAIESQLTPGKVLFL
jgi:hypothetical protein